MSSKCTFYRRLIDRKGGIVHNHADRNHLGFILGVLQIEIRFLDMARLVALRTIRKAFHGPRHGLSGHEVIQRFHGLGFWLGGRNQIIQHMRPLDFLAFGIAAEGIEGALGRVQFQAMTLFEFSGILELRHPAHINGTVQFLQLLVGIDLERVLVENEIKFIGVV